MRLTAVLIVALSVFLIPGAFAGLGGDRSSIDKDAQSLTATSVVAHQSAYDRYEISNRWLHLHEFVGHDGKVFALAWNGRRHPDLRALLGDHLIDYQNAIAQARRAHRRGGAITYDSGDMHLEFGGHMMSVYGIVWFKDRLPGGMDVREIR